MELLETVGRVAQNYGIGAAAAAAVALLLFRFYFAKFFDKNKNLATREDVEKLLQQLEAARLETEGIKTQLARINWLTQQQWLHGRCVKRTTGTPGEPPAAEPAGGSVPLGRGGS